MPIYRGAQKVHPMPGGMEVARVYRGDRLVYTSVVPSIYPVSGTWTGNPGTSGNTVMASHIIAEAGTFTVTHAAPSAAAILRHPGGTITGNTGYATWTGPLSAGDLLEFIARSFGNVTGTWTVTKH